MEIEEKLWSRVDWDIHDEERCWPWLASVDEGGYGQLQLQDITGKWFRARVHRLAYELEEGPIPKGFQIDHLCHDPKKCGGGPTCPHRRCCNPNHMKPVPQAANLASDRVSNWQRKKTHCSRGHEYDEENTYWGKKGRDCKKCRQIRLDEFWARKRK